MKEREVTKMDYRISNSLNVELGELELLCELLPLN